ncbi:MAG: hypothetical protein AAF456_10010 [Planctomycetota bacterium]
MNSTVVARVSFVLALLITALTGCGDSAGPSKDGGEMATSDALRSELYAMWMANIVKHEGRTEEQAEERLDEYVDKLIEAMREVEPTFLLVTSGTEAEIISGQMATESERRVSENLTPFTRNSTLVEDLLELRESGGISPTGLELLAQLLEVRRVIEIENTESE